MWILDPGDPFPRLTLDIIEWAQAMDGTHNIVEKTRLVSPNLPKPIVVSTVFLGMVHGYDSQSRPLLFETMVFGGKCDGYCERCATWTEAVTQHNIAVVRVKVSDEKLEKE